MNKYIELYRDIIELILKFRRDMKKYKLFDQNGINYFSFESMNPSDYFDLRISAYNFLKLIRQYLTQMNYDVDHTNDYHPDINIKTMMLFFIFTRLENYLMKLSDNFVDYICENNGLVINRIILACVDFFLLTIDDRWLSIDGVDYDKLHATRYIEIQYDRIRNNDFSSVLKALNGWDAKLIFEGLVYYRN